MPVYKQDGSGRLTALMVIHVDDCAIAGKKSTVEEIKKAIAKRLSIKDEGRLSTVSYTHLTLPTNREV